MSNDIEKLRELKREFVDVMIDNSIQYSTCEAISAALNSAIDAIAAPSAASAAPADERAKFEEWAKREDGGNWYDDERTFKRAGESYITVGLRYEWAAWQARAAIAVSGPKCELTDERIFAIHKETNCADSQIIAFARAIAAASGPNAGLVEALQFIVDRFGPSEHEFIFSKRHALQKARAALAAAGIKGHP